MTVSVPVDTRTGRPGTGWARWESAGDPAAAPSPPAAPPTVPHPIGERLRYDALALEFVRAIGLPALVERTLIVKPS